MKKQIIISLVIFFIVSLLLSCSKNQPLTPLQKSDKKGTIQLNMRMSGNITGGKVTITQDSLILNKDVPINNQTSSVIFPRIPSGPWNITIALYDMDGYEIYSGSGRAKVEINETTQVNVKVFKNTGNLIIVLEPHDNKDDNYYFYYDFENNISTPWKTSGTTTTSFHTSVGLIDANHVLVNITNWQNNMRKYGNIEIDYGENNLQNFTFAKTLKMKFKIEGGNGWNINKIPLKVAPFFSYVYYNNFKPSIAWTSGPWTEVNPAMGWVDLSFDVTNYSAKDLANVKKIGLWFFVDQDNSLAGEVKFILDDIILEK